MGEYTIDSADHLDLERVQCEFRYFMEVGRAVWVLLLHLSLRHQLTLPHCRIFLMLAAIPLRSATQIVTQEVRLDDADSSKAHVI